MPWRIVYHKPTRPHHLLFRAISCATPFGLWYNTSMKLKLHALFLAWAVSCTAHVAGVTIAVGAGESCATPSDAAKIVHDGDTVLIRPGVYHDVCTWRASRLTITGPRPPACATIVPPTDKQLAGGKGLWVVDGCDVSISDMSFEGAKCNDKNGAGLWIGAQSGTTRVERCSFSLNENGILTSAAPRAELHIERCRFHGCGHGDGYSHNIYVGRIARLVCRQIDSSHCRNGHCLKSRALVTEILDSRFDDGDDGLSSYLVNCPNGGQVLLSRSTLVQSPVAPNGIMVSLGEEGAYPGSTFRDEGNRFENRRTPGIKVRNMCPAANADSL